MGGCCCCSSKGAELNSAPTGYVYCPRAEHVPLSSHHGAASALPTGLLVDTNLETSIIDTYRPPPPPIPYDVDLGHPQTPPRAQEICGNKGDTTNSGCVEETFGGNTLESTAKSEDLKESDCKAQINSELPSANKQEVELSKLGDPIALATEEECPICLEEYDSENPKIIAKCDHHFHLACILEWMERSDTCPACDQEMIFNPPITE